MHSIRHTLDHNALYHLQLQYDPAYRQLTVAVTNPDDAGPRFVDAVLGQLQLVESAARDSSSRKRDANLVTFAKVGKEFTLRLGTEAIGSYSISDSGQLIQTSHRPLSVDETRRIGTFYRCPPYPMRRGSISPEQNTKLVNVAKQSVFTDFHTHSSGQISAKGLLDVAIKQPTASTNPQAIKDNPYKPYYYPLSLLEEAGIPTSFHHIPKKQRKDIKRVAFPPLDKPGGDYPENVPAADLTYIARQDRLNKTDHIGKLAAHMTLPANRQCTFYDLEYRGNKFRYPLSKDTSLTAAIRKREAQEYIAQGVEFALTSYVGIDKQDTLSTLHDTIDALKEDPATQGFTQRFMIGIPRGQQLSSINDMLEKAKILLESPYIMGVDMLGYEADKTKNFVHLLDEYAHWANDNKPGSFIRVHAGENDKNYDNVKDFLKIAVKYPNLHFLVGHGVYGMDEETMRLLKKLGDRVTVELNPSSNIALNNADDVKQLPFEKLLRSRIPFIVASDSAGMYQTSALQLGLATYHAGVDMHGFTTLREHQRNLVQHMEAYSARVAEAIPHWDTAEGRADWIKGMSERIAAVPRTPVEAQTADDKNAIKLKLNTDQVSLVEGKQLPAELQNKTPIAIIGASGASWKRLSKIQQRESAIAVDMLIRALGDDCYIFQGRNKKSGLSKIINQARTESNEERVAAGRPKLFNVGLHLNPEFDDTQNYKHLTHMIRIHGQTLDLAHRIVDHTFDHDGVLVAVNGAAYTRDTILEADRRGIRNDDQGNCKMMLLLANTESAASEGASAEKAAVLHPDYKAVDGAQLVKKLYEGRPDLFPANFKKATLNKMYDESKKRVDRWLDHVDNGNTIVSDTQYIPLKQHERKR